MELEIPLDKIRGFLIGGAVGDALGGPYERRSVPSYNGIITYPIVYQNQWHGTRRSVVGQLTDDTEMTLALTRALLEKGRFQRDAVVQAYLDWVGTGVSTIGENTRNLFKGVTTLRGYENRITKATEGPIEQWSLGNGSLMRCAPLALLWNNDDVVADCCITNPHPVSQDVSLVYITAVRLALLGYTKEKIFDAIRALPQTEMVEQVIADVDHKTRRDLSRLKGLCTQALYCALYCFRYFDRLEDALDWTINENPRSDTDTNAAITGSLFGAYLGYDQLMMEPKTSSNITIVRSTDTTQGDLPRPIQYSLHDFDAVCQGLFDRFGKVKM